MSTPITAHSIVDALMSQDDEKLKSLFFCSEEAEYPAIWYKIVLPDMARRKNITDDVLVDMLKHILYVKKINYESSGGYILILEMVNNIRPKAISFCIENGLFVKDICSYITVLAKDGIREKILSELSENAKAIMGILKV